jgi:hypothetical protein
MKRTIALVLLALALGAAVAAPAPVLAGKPAPCNSCK